MVLIIKKSHSVTDIVSSSASTTRPLSCISFFRSKQRETDI